MSLRPGLLCLTCWVLGRQFFGDVTSLVSLPDSADIAIEEMIDAVQPQITDALATLTDGYDNVIGEIVADMQACEHCQTQKYETYLTVLRRAFVRAHWD